MKRPIAPAVLSIMLALACSDNSVQNPPPPANVSVDVADDMYVPATVTVAPGTTVIWTWTGTNPHDVVWVTQGGPAGSPLQINGSYQRLFSAPGVFDYYCSIHGSPTTGMRGTVTVQ